MRNIALLILCFTAVLRAADPPPDYKSKYRVINVIDPADHPAVKKWQDRFAFNYGQAFQYFETDTPNLEDPAHSGGPWLRFPGIKLPPEVLEKLYHINAERLIPGLKNTR